MHKITTKHLKNTATLLTIIFAIFSYFFVKSALEDGEVKVLDQPEKEKALEIKPVKVTLTVLDPNTGGKREYKKRMQNNNSVLELLEKLREEDEFIYEKIAYTYGTEVDNINGIKAPEGYRWEVNYFAENLEITSNITFEIDDNYLIDKGKYRLKLEKVQ